jgi:uncharacterized membrane protein
MNRRLLFGPALLAAWVFLSSDAAAQGFGELEKEGDRLVLWLVYFIEIVGIAIIVLGVVATSLYFMIGMVRRHEIAGAYHRFRSNLGRAILLGLEFLVAADIIGTVAVDRTFRNLGILAVIVLIRTFLSFSLEVEIEGKWPWKRDSRAEGISGGRQP